MPSPILSRESLIPQAGTLMLAAAGAVTFYLLGLPLPFLFGPMTFCLIAALSGARLRGMGQVSIAARTILGVAVGASITPAVIGQIPQMAASVALVPVYVAAIGLIGVPYFRRLGLDTPTAYYASMPGGLPDMVAFGQEAGADIRALSLIHATRMAVLVTLAPVLLVWMYDAPLTGAMGQSITDTSGVQLVLMAAAALIGWKGGERIGLFGAAIIGPMIVTAILSLSGIITTRPPAEAIKAAQFFIGLSIGIHYVGVTLRELRHFVLTGLGFVLILAALATLFAEITVLAGWAQPMEGFLSFLPGGQAEVTVLSIIVGADLGFVITHHVTRLIVVITGAPIAARLLGLGKRRPPTP
ncbi:AbrB family transcriptional regulator [Paracoccus sp. (in: a-proteobacteria)]|uniref:AbrB family transcriptional regulator n=1 Tax=Paracoccus sp. TaxID=267 RepID=UPI0026E09AC0|nr:AbrB family transcriptional regulator [Paracoccus sp. (in: a-proteobacteria)]MDO5648301.1 AbrB family transcriptional regulator [Paracoccus sp. (in: a-proteobacteria)]